MPLDDAFRISAQRVVNDAITHMLSKDTREYEQGKQKWKYTHANDWHYGYWIGTLETLIKDIHKKLIGRPPNAEENLEISEMIEERANEIREYCNRNFAEV